jgi:hypothetical protein
MVYSRYADDLFISTSEPGVLNDALAFISHEAASYKYCRLRLNEKKTRFLSRRYHRSITGVVITSDRKISIGLARKRKLKQDIFLHTKGELPPEERTRLAGMLAFARDVEPTFYATLKRKYGAEQIKLIETPEAGGSVTVRAA